MANNEAQCETTRQYKYVDLLLIDNQLSDILQHIVDLNNKLGVNTPIREPSDDVKTPNIESLVSVLDHLPSMVSSKVNKIHDLLSNLEDNLN